MGSNPMARREATRIKQQAVGSGGWLATSKEYLLVDNSSSNSACRTPNVKRGGHSPHLGRHLGGGCQTCRALTPLQVQAGTGKVLLQEEKLLASLTFKRGNGCRQVGSRWRSTTTRRLIVCHWISMWVNGCFWAMGYARCAFAENESFAG